MCFLKFTEKPGFQAADVRGTCFSLSLAAGRKSVLGASVLSEEHRVLLNGSRSPHWALGRQPPRKGMHVSDAPWD